MKKIIYLFLLIMSVMLFNNKVSAYVEYHIGDIINYKGDRYYVMEESDSDTHYVTVLKGTPLTIDELYKYGRDESGYLFINEGIRNTDDPEMIVKKFGSNIGGISYYSGETCRYDYSFNGSIYVYDNQIEDGCIVDYDKSDVKKVLDNWSNDVFKGKMIEVDGYKTRLITVQELKNNFGYHYQIILSYSGIRYEPSETPRWLYGIEYPYWTMTPHEDSNKKIMVAQKNIEPNNVFNLYTVRPVVNLDKRFFDKNSNEICGDGYKSITKIGTNYNSFYVGDEVEYKGEKYYVIDNSSNSDNYVTLLKDKPLTSDELYKYGKDEQDNLFVNKYITNLDESHNAIYEYEDKIGGMAYKTNETCGCEEYSDLSTFKCQSYLVSGCSSNYDESDVKKVLDNWSNDVLKDKLIEVDGYKIRLITVKELQDNLGYYTKSVITQTGLSATPDTPKWVYQQNYNYWTMTPYEDSSTRVYINFTNGNLLATRLEHINSSSIDNNIFELNAVRPVINLNKCEIDNGCYEQEIECIENNNIEVSNDNQIVNVDNTLKTISNIILIVSFILIISGIIILLLIKNQRKNMIKK